MRYFRITCNALDPIVLAGPGGNSVLVRLPFHLNGQMLYATFKDGGYMRAQDADMGTIGPALDTMTLGGPGGPPVYKLFQDSALPQGAVDADIPLWSAHSVPLVQPPEPMPQPVAWPVLNVVVVPE